VVYNSKWLKKMDLSDVARLFAGITHGKIIKRDMFRKRMQADQEIYLHEFLYPILQGYDSVALNVDAEVGGSDQMFNMMVGRDLLKKYKNKEKFVILTPLLENPKTGKKLMSKSEGGYISLQDSPIQMFGKVMALPDEAVIPVLKYCTEMPLEEIDNIKGDNPRDLKVKLAKELVTIYYDEKKAQKSEQEFENVFKENKIPEDILEVKMSEKSLNILDLLVRAKITETKSEARRLVEQKGVKIDGQIEDSWQKEIEIKDGMIIQAGKRRFAKIQSVA
jgi:tyrosyl-tRNA synthetase